MKTALFLATTAVLLALSANSFANPIRIEAEDLSLETMRTESLSTASGGQIINLKGPGFAGNASGEFPGSTGNYDVFVGYHDENDGSGQLSVSVGGDSVDAWTLDELIPNSRQASADNFRVRQIADALAVSEGDSITIRALQGNWDHANVDYIEFVPVDMPPIEEFELVAVVAKVGGDYTNPLDAVDNLAEGDRWCRVSPDINDATSPCKIVIEPGEYVLPRTLVIPNWVIVEGSGRRITLLTAAEGVGTALVMGNEIGDDVYLQDLSIANRSGDGMDAVGVRVELSSTAYLRRVSVTASSLSSRNVGIDAGGVETSVRLEDSSVTASGGVEAIGLLAQDAIIENSGVGAGSASERTIAISDLRRESQLQIRNSSVAARAGQDGQNAVGISAGRLRMSDTEIEVIDGSVSNIGVRTSDPDAPIMISNSKVTVRQFGSADNVGYLLGLSDRDDGNRIDGLSVKVTGGASSTAFRITEHLGTVRIDNSTLEAGDAANSNVALALVNADEPPIIVRNSRLNAASAALLVDDRSLSEVQFLFSSIQGPIVLSTRPELSVSCTAVTDENNVFFANNCPE